MSRQIITISRFALSGFFITRGISRVISYEEFNELLLNIGIPLPPVLMALFIGIELSGGLILLLGYEVSVVSRCMILGTLLAIFLFQRQILPIASDFAIIGGLMLLNNTGGGETFLEYAKTDIEHLPDYKTRL